MGISITKCENDTDIDTTQSMITILVTDECVTIEEYKNGQASDTALSTAIRDSTDREDVREMDEDIVITIDEESTRDKAV